MPRVRKATAASRAGTSIDLTANRNPLTNPRRERYYGSFRQWLLQHSGLDFAALDQSPKYASLALVAYGKHLFYSGEPKYVFAETINATVDRHAHLRGHLSSVWAVLSKWEEAEPVERAYIMPPSVFCAAVSLAVLWRWERFAAALLIGVHGLLRPAEILGLYRKHLILPRDMMSSERICYIAILNPKTRRFLPRQHARISDELSVLFLDHVFGCTAQNQPLFACSGAVFKNRWDKVFKFLGIPTTEASKGITPKSLRGSGASWLYHRTEDIPRILWRGRWQSRKSLEHYLQDVMGQMLLADLIQEKQDLVRLLATHSSQLLILAARHAAVTARGAELECHLS